MPNDTTGAAYPEFDRHFAAAEGGFSVIGDGSIGGKAKGLAFIKRTLGEFCPTGSIADVPVCVPTLTVVATEVFAEFVESNKLWDIALSDAPDDRIAHAFVTAELPTMIVGDIWALIRQVHTPLAIRSSSMLEDALAHPFAGTYATKMIPNNQLSAELRFHRLSEAIKLVWASTFFADAKSYMQAIGRSCRDERMAVIIQEVVGERFGERFYPAISGVARTFNFYPTGRGRPEDGVVNLALGLGKQIVDGGVSWTYSPELPNAAPPVASPRDLLDVTQRAFWAVNMGHAPYDPVTETEYLTQHELSAADDDKLLALLVSTYDAGSDRLVMGTGRAGPRALTFAPLLDAEIVPINEVIRAVAAGCKQVSQSDVEIEFAMTLTPERGAPARFGLLQMRPMRVAEEDVSVSDADLTGERVLVASEQVLGNGVVEDVCDVVYVRPDVFDKAKTCAIAATLASFNQQLATEGRKYVLVGFGRWGSSDPWLGIPVTWPQISAAKVIVEATLPDMDVEPSQGSHFFHNLTGMRVMYLTVHHSSPRRIGWDWLAAQPALRETELLRHVRLPSPLTTKIDGRRGRGVILR